MKFYFLKNQAMKILITCLFSGIVFCSNAQTEITVPVRDSSLYSQGYYDTWVVYLEKAEIVIADDTSFWQTKAMEYFNRFLIYAKMQTNESREILSTFMDGFSFEKHYFCNQYNLVLPLKGSEYEYLWKMYGTEKPMMDALCGCLKESYDTGLIEKLKEIKEKDQRYRSQLETKTLEELKTEGLWQLQLELDAENLKQVKKLIDSHGYPDRSQVGYPYEEIAFLVIQHSELEFMEKCLPLLLKASEEKKLNSKYYAYLYDRIQMLKGQPQLYGTQFTLKGEVYLTVDPKNLENRRRKVGL